MDIGITPLYGIGDTLLYTPAVRALKEVYSEYSITAFTFFPTTRDIIRNNPYIDHVVYFPMLKEGKLKTLLFLKSYARKFDVVINFYPSNRKEYNLFALMLLPGKIIGHRYKKNSFKNLNFVRSWTLDEDYSLHVVEENLRLLEFFGIKTPGAYPLQLFLSEEEKDMAVKFLSVYNTPLKIGIHPGTSSFKNHEKRRWPVHNFISLGKIIRDTYKDAVMFVFGGPEENHLKEHIRKELEGILDVVPVITKDIRETAAIMSFMDVFISNDSGLMHIAAALKLPIVAIFGPTNPAWVRPWKTEHEVVRLDLECSPCFHYSPKPLTCPAGLNFKCLRDLKPEAVYGALKRLLTKQKQGEEKLKIERKT